MEEGSPARNGFPLEFLAAGAARGIVDRMARIERLADDLVAIDAHYNQTEGAISVYLLLGARPALVETGPASTVETVLDGIREAGLDPMDLRAAAVTHIHLDHSGAAGTLAALNPNLEIYVHPIGAPHLIDPARLIASARRLYGPALDTLLGEPQPIASLRVHVLRDGEQVELGSRTLTAFSTPGHATHHHVFLDPRSADLFTGDAAGVALAGSRYVSPPTPPPELDFAAWRQTLGRLRDLRPRRLLLTHFGPQTWVEQLLTDLQARLDIRERLALEAATAGWDEATLTERLKALTEQEIAEAAPGEERRYEVMTPLRNNVLGLLRYAARLPRRVGR
jgi:glyoxylase-like metal-dependent hydrolase (beta-lactamase superfamily II)